MKRFVISIMFVAVVLLCLSRAADAQAEVIGGVHFNPPKDWVRTEKPGAVVLTENNTTTNNFCIVSIYGQSRESGTAETEFTEKWSKYVAQPFNVRKLPATTVETRPDGWTTITGGALVSLNGDRPAAILTVFRGFGKSAAVLTIFNIERYAFLMQRFLDELAFDKPAQPNQRPIRNSTKDH